MIRALAATILGTALLGAGDIPWVKLDAARQQANASLLPILVYAQVDSKGEGC